MELILNIEIENNLLREIVKKNFENLLEIYHEEEKEFENALTKGIINDGGFALSQATKYESMTQTIKTTVSASIKVKGESSSVYQNPDQMTFPDVDS